MNPAPAVDDDSPLGPVVDIDFEGIRFSIEIHSRFDRYISAELGAKRVWEPFESRVFESLCEPSGTVVDIGANLGWYSLIASARVGRDGTVLALEPEPANYAMLIRNLARNDARNVIPHRAAVGTGQGTVEMFLSDENLGDHRLFDGDENRERVPVEMTTLDRLLDDHAIRPTLIKCDTQGSELAVVRGLGADRFDPRTCAWIVEFWPRGLAGMNATPDPLLRWFDQFGYRFYEVSEGNPRLVRTDRSRLMQRVSTDLTEASGMFINLLLIHPDDRRHGKLDRLESEPFASASPDLPSRKPRKSMNSDSIRHEPTPTLETITSQLCTSEQFGEPIYDRLCKEINQQKLFHRKQWEYIYILRALEQLCALRPSASGLGFGCGKEPLAAVMAKRDVDVICTDIEPVEKGDAYWGSTNVRDYFYEGICSWEQFEKHVRFRPADMNAIPDDLGVHDFIWSSCALEHLGSLQHGIDFVLNANKCLKAGGVAVHTTELNVEGEDETFESTGLSLYRRKDIARLQQLVEAQGHVFLPVNFNLGGGALDKYVDLPPFNRDKHLKLMVEEKYVTTSIGFVILKR